MKLADTYYLLSITWFRPWHLACSSTSDSLLKPEDQPTQSIQDLTPIDNSDLLDENFDLKPALLVGTDLEIISPDFWASLVKWYGLSHPTRHLIPRQVIAPNGPGSQTLELYPPRFHFYLLVSTEGDSEDYPATLLPLTAVQVRFSIGLTLAQFKTRLSQDLFDPLLARPFRLWRISGPLSPDPRVPTCTLQTLSTLSPELIQTHSEDADLNEALLTDPENYLVVEQQTRLANWLVSDNPPTSTLVQETSGFGGQNWLDEMERMNQVNRLDPKYKLPPPPPAAPPPPAIEASSSGESSGGLFSQLKRVTRLGASLEPKPPHTRGLIGLSNLGNTCCRSSFLARLCSLISHWLMGCLLLFF